MITKRLPILVCVWILLSISPTWTLPERIEEWSDVEGSRPLRRVKRIIGGHPVLKGAYPWAVSIQARRYHGLNAVFRPNNEHYCGAALIKPDWIVTAAHCLYTEDDNGNLESYLDPKMWHVRLASDKLQPGVFERVKGLFRRAFNAIFGYVKLQPYYHVKKIFHHPNYRPGDLEYDIALFQLKEEPVLRKIAGLGLVELPDPMWGDRWPAAGQTCIAVGWGCSFAEGPPSMKGQFIELPVLSPSVCRRMYSAYINLTTTHEFCAGYHNGNKGICPGDSGGPLVCQAIDGEMKLAGVVSATHSKQPADFPAIFTRVSYFTDWINSVIENNPHEEQSNLFSFLHLHN